MDILVQISFDHVLPVVKNMYATGSGFLHISQQRLGISGASHCDLWVKGSQMWHVWQVYTTSSMMVVFVKDRGGVGGVWGLVGIMDKPLFTIHLYALSMCGPMICFGTWDDKLEVGSRSCQACLMEWRVVMLNVWLASYSSHLYPRSHEDRDPSWRGSGLGASVTALTADAGVWSGCDQLLGRHSYILYMYSYMWSLSVQWSHVLFHAR